jgi:hypothetical protein
LGRGFVKVQNFRNSSNKRGYAYLLTPAGVAAKADLTRRFLAMKMEEYDRLRVEIERLRGETASDEAAMDNADNPSVSGVATGGPATSDIQRELTR